MAQTSMMLRQGTKSISFYTKLIRSYSTSAPPHPIPNRPLRDDRRRRPPPPPPTQPPPKIQTPQFKKPFQTYPNDQNDPKGAEFLERFKLGFEKTDEDDKFSPEKDVKDVKESEEVSVPADADEIFKKMKETGLIPNAVAMLDGLCKDGLVQEAMKLFGLMREKGTIPEVVIYTGVVEGFCKAHKFDDAIRVFGKMKSNGIEPNAFSYGVLVRGLCKGGRLEEGVEFCVEMLETGHSPNLATFVGLVDGFCREKGLDDAKSLIAILKEKGLFYDEKACREYLDKKGPFSDLVWEAIVGKKPSRKSSFFD